MPQNTMVTHGKRKIREASNGLSKQVATVLNVDKSVISFESEENKSAKETEQKSRDLDYLVSLMKEKLNVSTRRQKIQILTLTPKS